MNLKDIHNHSLYEAVKGDWQNKSEQDIQNIISFVKNHWLYRSQVLCYGVGACVALMQSISHMATDPTVDTSSVILNAIAINSMCLMGYFIVWFIRRSIGLTIGDPLETLYALSPLREDAELCAVALECASTKQGGEYRDKVLEQGRELLRVDLRVMKNLAWSELREREIQEKQVACKQLHKIVS